MPRNLIVIYNDLIYRTGALGVGPPLELNPESFLSHAINGATCVSESLLVFAFAAVGLDFCFKTGLISTFPLRRTDSN